MFESFAATCVANNRIAVDGHNLCIGCLRQIAAEHLTMLLFKLMVKLAKKSADKRLIVLTAEIKRTARGGWEEVAATRDTRELNHR